MRKSAESVETTVPRDTPHDWRRTTLGDIGEYINGRGFKKSEWAESGLPIIRIQNLTGTGKEQNYYDGEIDERHVVNPGDLLISWAATLGAYLWTGPQAALNQHIFKVRSHVDKKFHYYLMQHILSDLYRQTHGSGMVHITKSKFDSMPVVVPNTEDGQKRIVAEIEKQFSRLDGAVANLKHIKANLKRYKCAVLKAAVEGRLIETEAELARRKNRGYETGEQLLQRILETRHSQWKGKGKYKEPAAPVTNDLPELPEGWVWATMPQLGELNRGKSKHRPRDDKKLYGGLYPFIQTSDVRKSNGTITDYCQTYSEFGLKQSRLWPAGTLCITIAANIAETGILKFAACFPDSIVGFLIETSATTTRYIEYFIRTAREKLERFAPATAQKNINLEVLEAVAVPLPPLAEQQRIIVEVDRCISLVREVEAQIDVNAKRAEHLRSSILVTAFSIGN